MRTEEKTNFIPPSDEAYYKIVYYCDFSFIPRISIFSIFDGTAQPRNSIHNKRST